MRLLQLSDPHVRRIGDPLSGRVETLPYFDQAIAFTAALIPKPDLVLITGDLVDLGLREEYELVRAALARLDLPVLVLPGNHDDRFHCRAVLDGYLGQMLSEDCLAYVEDKYSIRVIALDSVIPGSGEGRLGAQQLKWLEQILDAGSARPTLIALHHPPFDVGIGFMDRLGLQDRDELLALLARHEQVMGVVAGHVHRTIFRRLGNTLGMIAPSTAHQIPLELNDTSPEVFIFEPPGCLLHEWDGKALRSHQVYLGDHGPRYRFGSGEVLEGEE